MPRVIEANLFEHRVRCPHCQTLVGYQDHEVFRDVGERLTSSTSVTSLVRCPAPGCGREINVDRLL